MTKHYLNTERSMNNMKKHEEMSTYVSTIFGLLTLCFLMIGIINWVMLSFLTLSILSYGYALTIKLSNNKAQESVQENVEESVKETVQEEVTPSVTPNRRITDLATDYYEEIPFMKTGTSHQATIIPFPTKKRKPSEGLKNDYSNRI